MNNAIDYPELASVEQQPLKSLCYKDKLVIKGDVASFEASKVSGVVAVLTRVLVYAFWAGVVYNVAQLNFILFDEAPLLISILLTLLLFIVGLFLTIVNFVSGVRLKSEEYIDKKTKQIQLLSTEGDKQYNTDDIIGFQLISYIKERKIANPRGVSSSTVMLTLYEINFVTQDRQRTHAITLNDRKSALIAVQGLSDFLEKPYIKNIEETQAEYLDKEADKIIKHRLRVIADLVVEKSVLENTFDNLTDEMEYEITKTNDHEYVISMEDQALAFLFSDKKLGKIESHIYLTPSSDPLTTGVNIKTKLRYDIILSLPIIVALFFIDAHSELMRIFIGVSIGLLVFRIVLHRLEEYSFVQTIVASLLKQVK